MSLQKKIAILKKKTNTFHDSLGDTCKIHESFIQISGLLSAFCDVLEKFIDSQPVYMYTDDEDK